MGSAASTLTSEQSSKLTHILKEKYEKYQEEKLNDDEIRAKITEEYNHIIADLKKSHPAGNERSSRPSSGQPHHVKTSRPSSPGGEKSAPRVGLSSKFHGKSNALNSGSAKGGAAKGGARRRSFDQSTAGAAPANPAKKVPPAVVPAEASVTDDGSTKDSTVPPPVATEAATATVTEAAPVVAEAHTAEKAPEAVDSWDSVRHQPFCTICQMAFKSDAFLDRHVKFSDLHIQNVKRKEAGEGVAGHPAPGDGAAVAHELLKPKQVEGEHFKMLYTGSKLFWRTQDNIDFHFFHHILPHCIEIIPYDATKDKELNRIYLDYAALADLVNKHYGDFKEKDEDGQRLTITTFILQRIQLFHIIPGEITTVFAKLAGDENERTPVLERPPVVLVPVVVTRRRRTNAEEIESTISNLNHDRAELVAATHKAERVANLVYVSAQLIAAKKWYAAFNAQRRRWIRAIRRVIRQKHVAHTKEVLAQRELALKSGSTKGQRRENVKAKEI